MSALTLKDIGAIHVVLWITSLPLRAMSPRGVLIKMRFLHRMMIDSQSVEPNPAAEAPARELA
jgi:hypothetical protein